MERLKDLYYEIVQASIAQASATTAHAPIQSTVSLPCSAHPMQQLDLYCESCRQVVCRECILHDHKEHQYRLLAEVSEKHKGAILRDLKEVEKRAKTIAEALVQVEEADCVVDKSHGRAPCTGT